MKDFGAIVKKLYKHYENEELTSVVGYHSSPEKFYNNSVATKKLIAALKSENMKDSGFDWVECDQLLSFLIGQRDFYEEKAEDYGFTKKDLDYMIGMGDVIDYMLKNMELDHNGKAIDENHVAYINKSMHRIRYDKDVLNDFNERASNYEQSRITECLGCNK